MKKVGVLLVIILIFTTSGVLASGLSIPEQGTAALGMSAAMTARSEDLSALYYNPAGINYVDSFEIMLGVTPIRPRHEYSPLVADKNNFDFENKASGSQTFLPPFLYAAYRASDTIVLGLGVNAPTGLGTDWNKLWNGRYTSTFAEIATVHITPTIAYQATEKVSVGLGVSYVTSTATIEKMVDTGSTLFYESGGNPAAASLIANTDYDSHFGLEGDGTGYTYNLGLLYEASETMQLGVSFRGAVDIDYDGTAKFTHKENAIRTFAYGATMQQLQGLGLTEQQMNALATAQADTTYMAIAAGMPSSQSGSATLHMPWMLNFGMKTDMTEVWDISADFNIVGWSVYDELTIDFDDDKPYDKLTQDKDWKNSYVFRLGSSYDVNESLIAQCGAMYDTNPVPDNTFDGQLPDADRYGLSIGAGYKLGMIQLDASYMLLNFRKREKSNGVGFSQDTTGDGEIDSFDVPPGYPVGNGKYESRAHLFSISASYIF